MAYRCRNTRSRATTYSYGDIPDVEPGTWASASTVSVTYVKQNDLISVDAAFSMHDGPQQQ